MLSRDYKTRGDKFPIAVSAVGAIVTKKNALVDRTFGLIKSSSVNCDRIHRPWHRVISQVEFSTSSESLWRVHKGRGTVARSKRHLITSFPFELFSFPLARTRTLSDMPHRWRSKLRRSTLSETRVCLSDSSPSSRNCQVSTTSKFDSDRTGLARFQSETLVVFLSILSLSFHFILFLSRSGLFFCVIRYYGFLWKTKVMMMVRFPNLFCFY